MAEWLKAAVLKTASREPGRGFESYSLRQKISVQILQLAFNLWLLAFFHYSTITLWQVDEI